MARAWEISPTIVGFNFDKPEETILIHHFDLAIIAAPDDEVLTNFGDKFFEQGMGVSEVDFRHILEISQNCSSDAPGLRPQPSARSTYIDNRNAGKAAARQHIRDQLRSSKGRDILLNAYADLDRLETMSPNDWEIQKHLFERFEQGAVRHDHRLSESTPSLADSRHPLTEEEIKRRHAVLHDRQNAPTRERPSIKTGEASQANQQPPGMGEQPDLEGVDLLKYFHSDRLAAEGVPEPVIKQQKTTTSDLLRDIQAEIRKTNALLTRLVEAAEKG